MLCYRELLGSQLMTLNAFQKDVLSIVIVPKIKHGNP